MVAGNERRLIVTPDVKVHAHYLLVGRFRRANLWLGIPAVVGSRARSRAQSAEPRRCSHRTDPG